MSIAITCLLVVAGAYVLVALYERYGPVPASIYGPPLRTFVVPEDRVTLHFDTTRFSHDERIRDVCIVERVFAKIRQADHAVFEVFLLERGDTESRPSAPETRRFADVVRASGADVVVLADPVNTLYGTRANPPFDWLVSAGARVVPVRLETLRHNSTLYAPLYALLAPLLPRRPMVEVPVEGGKVLSPYAIATALAARADHRKVLTMRSGGSCSVLVMSANLCDAAAYFDNAAVEIDDPRVTASFLTGQIALARASGATIGWTCDGADVPAPVEDARAVRVTPLSGRRIAHSILADVAATRRGDTLVVGVLFLSSRACIEALVRADARGVCVHVVMDNNQESFGALADGFPNRVVARELSARSPGMDVRWHRTDVQYHTKIVYIARDNRRIFHVGSANLTRRSLIGTNLEANVRLEMSSASEPARQVDRYVESLLDDACSRRADPDEAVPLLWRLAYRVGEPIGLINC